MRLTLPPLPSWSYQDFAYKQSSSTVLQDRGSTGTDSSGHVLASSLPGNSSTPPQDITTQITASISNKRLQQQLSCDTPITTPVRSQHSVLGLHRHPHSRQLEDDQNSVCHPLRSLLLVLYLHMLVCVCVRVRVSHPLLLLVCVRCLCSCVCLHDHPQS